jgi:hypothetical protein
MGGSSTLLEDELARREAGGLVVREGAMRLGWTFTGLPAADGIAVEVRYEARVRAVDGAADRAMLMETFLTRGSSLTGKEIAAYFAPALEAAARRIVATRPVADWINPQANQSELLEALNSACRAGAFTSGLEWLAPFQLEVTSHAFQRQQLAGAERKLVEERDARRLEHLERSIALTDQFNRLRQAAPELSAGQLLERIAPSDQVDLLHNLLLASSNSQAAKTLYMVVGPRLVRLDPQSLDTQILPLSSALGLPRSIRAIEIESQQRLLIGTQRGVLLVDPQLPDDAIAYPRDAADSSLGFNSTLVLGQSLYATHSEAGLIRWNLNNPSAPAQAIALPAAGGGGGGAHLVSYQTTGGLVMTAASTSRPMAAAPGPRHLTKLDDTRGLFSLGAQCYTLEGDQITPAQITPTAPAASTHPIIAIVPTSTGADAHPTGDIAIVHADGVVQRLAADTLKPISAEPRAGRLSSAGALAWMGTRRLLLATADGPIACVGLDDAIVTQYQSHHRGFRRVAASASLIAAISADRQRVILWHPASPQAPTSELSIAQIAGHRIADLAFA